MKDFVFAVVTEADPGKVEQVLVRAADEEEALFQYVVDKVADLWYELTPEEFANRIGISDWRATEIK